MMTRTEVIADDLHDDILRTAAEVKQITGSYPTIMTFNRLTAKKFNMKFGVWELRNGVWRHTESFQDGEQK